jgi:hypothetical protein
MTTSIVLRALLRSFAAASAFVMVSSCGGGGGGGGGGEANISSATTTGTASGTNLGATSNISSGNANSNPLTPPVVPLITSAPTCAALKNGAYELIDAVGNNAAESVARVSFDAPSMAITNGSSVTNWTADTTACSFTAPAGKSLVVSQSGIGFLRTLNASAKSIVQVMIPVQSFALADLAGRFNYLTLDRITGETTYNTNSGFFRFTAAGAFDTAWICRYGGADEDTCNFASIPSGFSPNANGGFNAFDVNGEPLRIFGFKGADGTKVLFMVRLNAGGLIVATPDTALVRPLINAVSSERRVDILSNGQSSQWTNLAYTVTGLSAIDANRFTRQRTSDSLFEEIQFNSPSAGIAVRQPDANYGNISLPMSRLGFTAILDTVNNSLGFSVAQ